MSAPFVARPSWLPPALDDGHAVHAATPSSGEGWAAPAPARGLTRRPEASGSATSSLAADLDLLGPLAPYAARGAVTDLFVNGPRGLWIDRGAGAERVIDWAADEHAVRALAIRLVSLGSRHLDEATPAVDVRLGRGIRVHAVLPPIATGGTTISVRIPRAGGRSLADLVTDAGHRTRLLRAVERRENLLVTGAAGSGKTTLLAALLAEVPASERIVVIEDVAELAIDHPHVVGLEARQPNLEGSGRVGLDTLVREALRMRPDRIVVGECRGPELRELLGALNTGHDGGAGTLHANSLADVPARLEALGAGIGLSSGAVARLAASALDLVVHLERRGDARVIAGIGALRLAGGRLVVEAETERAGAA